MLLENHLRQKKKAEQCIKNMVAGKGRERNLRKRIILQMAPDRQPYSNQFIPLQSKGKLQSVSAIQSLEALGYLM